MVASGWALTARAGMVPIGTQAMGPTIKELLAIAGGSDSDRRSRGSRASGGDGSGGDRWGKGRCGDGGVGAVVAGCSEGGELAEPFTVGLGEMRREPGKSPFVLVQVAPLLDGSCKYARVLENEQRQTNDGGIGDRLVAGGCKTLDFLDLGPEVFDRLVRVPLGR